MPAGNSVSRSELSSFVYTIWRGGKRHNEFLYAVNVSDWQLRHLSFHEYTFFLWKIKQNEMLYHKFSREILKKKVNLNIRLATRKGKMKFCILRLKFAQREIGASAPPRRGLDRKLWGFPPGSFSRYNAMNLFSRPSSCSGAAISMSRTHTFHFFVRRVARLFLINFQVKFIMTRKMKS